jgi:autotransporter-associated beta strand protein
MKRKPTLQKLSLIGLSLMAAGTASAFNTYTWTGAASDLYLGNTNNWSPITAAGPVASGGDIIQWSGLAAGNLILTNGLANFDSNPGFQLRMNAAQTGAVTIVMSNSAGGRMRLTGTNTIFIDSGAGALSIGNGGATPFPIALAGRGNGEVHSCTNNSANTATFNSEVYFLMGGGGSHTLALAGTGNWALSNSFQPQNGAAMGLTVNGPGTTTLVGTPTPGVSFSGTYGNVQVNAGTLALAAANAIGTGNTLVMNGGALDCVVSGGMAIYGDNPQTWSGNWTFVGTQNLDMGYGPVTNTGSRIVTVNAKQLTVNGPFRGGTASFTKAGPGTMIINGTASYVNGTVVSNGVLRLANLPSGSGLAESVATYGAGTLDVYGSSFTVSALSGTGVVDTTMDGGTPVLTVGDYSTNAAFSGSIKNTAGTMSLTKIGNGTLTLGGASTYSGGTTVSAGMLYVTNTSGSATGSGAVTVNSGAKFGGTGIVSGAVDWQSGAGAIFGLNLAGGVNTTPMQVGGSVTLSGNAVTVYVPGVLPLDPGTYTLMTYNTSGSSGAFATSGVTYTGAGVSPGTSSTISTSGGTVTLTVISLITGSRSTWTNTVSGNWSVGANWSSNPTVPHAAGDLATLGFGTAFATVTLDASESVGGVVFTNSNSFEVADGGSTLTFDNNANGALISVAAGTSNSVAAPIALNDSLSVSLYPGTAVALSNTVANTSSAKSVLLSGSGTVTLAGNNTYGPAAGSPGTMLNAGVTVQLGSSTALGAGDVTVTNGTEVVRALAPLALANNIALVDAPMAFDNNGKTVTLSGAITGTGALTVSNTGTLTLAAANSYAGDTTISGGLSVKLGVANAIPGNTGYGNINLNTNCTLDVNGFSPILNGLNGSGTLDNLAGGNVSVTLGESGSYATFTGNVKNTAGVLAVVKDGAGNQTLGGNNTYTGGTTINAGTLRVGNGNTNAGTSGIAVGLGTGPVVNNSTLEFNLYGTNIFTNAISGAGAINVANSGETLMLTGPNAGFTGNISVNLGTLMITNASQVGTGPKTIYATAAGSSQRTDIRLYGGVTMPASISYQLTYLNGVLYNMAGTNALLGDIALPYGGGACYIIVSNGFLTLAGNVASDGVANGRTFQLGGPGNGLFSGVAQDNAQTLGSLTKVDSGTWTVSGANTTQAAMNVNGGKLVLNGQWAGAITVNAGTTLFGTGIATSNMTVNPNAYFVPGAFGSIGTFTVYSNLTLAGTMYASLNRSQAQNSTLVSVGSIYASNSTSLVLSNLGPSLVVGDRFQIFSQPVTNGSNITIVAPAGVAFTNNLDLDGSISVVPSMATNPTNITYHLSGGQLTMTWPGDHLGWILQSQTNQLNIGLSTNWYDVAGSSAATQAVITVDATKPTVFYRLRKP